MPYFTTPDGCKIFYTTYGLDTSKPVVIFLNGITQTTLYWGNHVPGFSKRHALVFYDARGQGQSCPGTRSIALDRHVSDFNHLLEHLAVDKAHLMGISHGARLALELALKIPKRVDRLVLCSTSVQTSQRCRAVVRSWIEILKLSGLKAMAWAALPTVFGSRFLEEHQKILEKIVNAVVLRNNRAALIEQLGAILSYPAPDIVTADFEKPTLVLTGSEDPLVEPQDVQQLVHHCRAVHHQLSGDGHSIPAEAPELFQQMVLEFLNSEE